MLHLYLFLKIKRMGQIIAFFRNQFMNGIFLRYLDRHYENADFLPYVCKHHVLAILGSP